MHIISGDGWSWSSGATALERLLVGHRHEELSSNSRVFKVMNIFINRKIERVMLEIMDWRQSRDGTWIDVIAQNECKLTLQHVVEGKQSHDSSRCQLELANARDTTNKLWAVWCRGYTEWLPDHSPLSPCSFISYKWGINYCLQNKRKLHSVDKSTVSVAPLGLSWGKKWA